MTENKSIQLVKAAKELNVGIHTLVDHLAEKGQVVENKPTTKLSPEQYNLLLSAFKQDLAIKKKAEEINIGKIRKDKAEEIREEAVVIERPRIIVEGPKVVGKMDLDAKKPAAVEPVAKPSEPVVVPEAPKVEKPAAEPVVKPEPVKPEPAKPESVKAEPVKPEPAKAEKVKSEPVQAEAVKEEPKKAEPIQPESPKAETVEAPIIDRQPVEKPAIKVVDKIDLSKKKPAGNKKPTPTPAAKKPAPKVITPAPVVVPITHTADLQPTVIRAEAEKLSGVKIMGKIELPDSKKPSTDNKKSYGKNTANEKRKRKRIGGKVVDVNKVTTDDKGATSSDRIARPAGPPRGRGPAGGGGVGRPLAPGARRPGGKFTRGGDKPRDENQAISGKEIDDKIKATMAKLGGGNRSRSNKSKYRKTRRDDGYSPNEESNEISKISVTEFISVSELANIMNVSPTQVISACFGLGVIVSINQRIDAEVIELVAGEFGFEVDFINIIEDEETPQEEENPEDLISRSPIVTIMGHVDHGKTSLLDYIRSATIVTGEAGGITQHIGAYEVTLPDSQKQITFLDTPGHEAFTAMRARGAKLTDIVVIVVAADDNVMPQTKEAISHAQAAEVPMIIAINKMDKPTANPENIKKQLADMNILIEEWGGKYQCQEISAKKGTNVEDLLEKILLEAELLDLKANPNKIANGSVIEASLDKGRGYVSTLMVQDGTLNIGDFVVAGQYYGKVKALSNERGTRIKKAKPSQPVQLLGLNGAPTAGDKFKVYLSEQEAKEIANKRSTILREQGIRATKHITLDEIGRRLALGNFKELKIIVKGDVDGSVEALSDSLLKLSTEEIQVSIVLSGVGAITENDVLLAAASDAIIVAFQVRPSANARQLADRESIEIRNYSIIYDAIDDVKKAMEGMLEPKFEDKIVANVEVREVFKISKLGSIAGCYVQDGKILRANGIRVIRDGIVVYEGELEALKRYKDDVREVAKGFECGIKIKNYNDIQVNDIIESFEKVAVKRKL